jgi:hypothetical protein
MAATTTTGRDLVAEFAFLTRALKAPTLRTSVARLAERARAEGWTHEEFLVACLQRALAARQAHGGEGRIRAARFPARKSLEEFDFDHARGRNRDTVAHLGTWTSWPHGRTWCSSAHPAPARPIWPSGWGSGPARPATGCCWPPPPSGSPAWPRHAAGRLQAELVRLGRYPLLVVDEVGYIPFEAEACSSSSSRPLRTGLADRRPQRRLLPAQGPRPWSRPRGHHQGAMTARGSVFTRRQGVSFPPSLTGPSPLPTGHGAAAGSKDRGGHRRLNNGSRPLNAQRSTPQPEPGGARPEQRRTTGVELVANGDSSAARPIMAVGRVRPQPARHPRRGGHHAA